MNLHDLKPAKGATKHSKRIGRGQGSGKGGTSTKGHKGAQSRSGYSRKAGFEGGQMPLYRRLPKRGFKCRNSKDIVALNVDRLNCFEDGAEVTISSLVENGVISNPRDGVKILGSGELVKKLNVRVTACSESAKAKIEAAGGTVEVI